MSTRSDLVDQLHETMKEIITFCTDEDKGRDWGGVLLTSVNMVADEETLQRINDDLQEFLTKVKQTPQ